jgi:ubiquinone/menaquinone biosynthesis C-methylase UbiE
MKRLVKISLAALAILLIAQIVLRIYLQFRRTPIPPQFGFLLRSRWRRLYRDPARTLAPLDIRPGMTVLEVGPGVGTFSVEAARRVGADGKLIAVDIQPEFLEQTSTVVEAAGVRHVELYSASVTTLPLDRDSVDRAFLIAVLPEVPNIAGALSELRRVLKPGGLLLISEEIIEPEYVPPMVTERWATSAGLEVESRHGNAFCYTLVFRNPAPGA